MGKLMLKNILKPVVFLGIIITTGCTSIPPVDFTVADIGVVDNRKNVELKSLTVGFAPQSQQGKVEANATIPPVWKEALQDALNAQLRRYVNESELSFDTELIFLQVELLDNKSEAYEVVDRGSETIDTKDLAKEGTD